MKISSVSPYYKQKQVKAQRNVSSPIAFKGDSFEKNPESLKNKASSLKERLNKLINNTNSNDMSLNQQEKMHDSYLQILEEYKIVDEALSKSSRINYERDANIVLSFLESLDNMSKDKGFNRISGYDDIKNKLRKEFVVSSIMMDRTSQGANVPNAILFYGPSNNGKSTFAYALAEQTLSSIYEINAAKFSEEVTMDTLQELAEKSLENYNKSPEKKRTIIVINEAEDIANKDSEILDRFRNLIKDCSEKYKCTLFLTTNHPRLIEKDILSKMAFKVPVEPADEKTCYEIVKNKFNMAKISPKGDIDDLVNAFFADRNKTFANGDIVDIVIQTISKTPNPEIKDFINSVENFEKTSISNKSLMKFEEDKRALSQ